MLDYTADQLLKEYKGNYLVWWKLSFLLSNKYIKDSSKNKTNFKSFLVILRKKENMAKRTLLMPSIANAFS